MRRFAVVGLVLMSCIGVTLAQELKCTQCGSWESVIRSAVAEDSAYVGSKGCNNKPPPETCGSGDSAACVTYRVEGKAGTEMALGCVNDGRITSGKTRTETKSGNVKAFYCNGSDDCHNGTGGILASLGVVLLSMLVALKC